MQYNEKMTERPTNQTRYKNTLSSKEKKKKTPIFWRQIQGKGHWDHDSSGKLIRPEEIEQTRL